ncbi:hypothetical protein DH2020_000813 [Rehmannia glutinosa]|uniref:Uncharacterized protein n=1 Tax=Rehmannia glutinosa TaxID=99300 RepID=A0ABR0XY66_REHGL
MCGYDLSLPRRESITLKVESSSNYHPPKYERTHIPAAPSNPDTSPLQSGLMEHKILILAITEPMTQLDFPYLCGKLSFQFGIANKTNKIWVFWTSSVTSNLVSDNDQSIDLEFSSPLFSSHFCASFIYAKSTRIERRTLSDDLRTSASTFHSLPWIVEGYFNCFLHSEERVGSNFNRALDMEEFGQMVSDCGLIDIGSEGTKMHTWVRNHLKERLDRIFLNIKWDDFFAHSCVKHLPRVFQMWLRHHTFLANVAEVWAAPTGFPGLVNLHHKLIRVKQRLKWWNRNVFGDIFETLKEAEHKVEVVGQIFDSSPTPENRSSLHHAIVALVFTTKVEEDFWHQKSSCKWIVEDDIMIFSNNADHSLSTTFFQTCPSMHSQCS